MIKETRTITILNLVQGLSSEMREYFSSRSMRVVESLMELDGEEWTHLLTKDVTSFDSLNDVYDVVKNNRHIISLSAINDIQNFAVNNGDFIIDETWFLSPMGSFIFDKYFQGVGGISLEDNYPSFSELGSFNVTNPFNTGEYLDRMVHKAFENGIEALSLKTYFDHLMMYTAGLKKKGKLGYPLEVTYGFYEGVFALQVHFFSEHVDIFDVATSLSPSISKKTEEHLLHVAVHSADFFDFSFIPEVKKVIITALWVQDERINFSNRGLMFSSLNNGASLVKYDVESISSTLVSDSGIGDFTENVVIPDHMGDDKESITTVKGSALTPDEALLISDDQKIEELVQKITGKFEEDKSVAHISGNKLDVDKFVMRIASSVDETNKESNFKVRSLAQKLPESIKTGLYDFAKTVSKSVEDLDEHELLTFQTTNMPRIIRDGLKSETQTPMSPSELKTNSPELLAENQKLKNQLKTLASEVKILKESRQKMAEIQMKASQATNQLQIDSTDEDDTLRTELQRKLAENKSLDSSDVEKLSSLIEREARIIADLKQEEIKNRKLSIEAAQKESFFSQELEKTERQVKAKELMLIKTKENFSKLIEKKDKELGDYKLKIDQLSKALTQTPSQSQASLINDLERQNQNLVKQIDVYKIKMTSLASNMQTTKSDDNFKDEARKLQMLNQQLKNLLDASKKESERLQSKVMLDGQRMNDLRQEKSKLELALKKAQMESQKEVQKPEANIFEQESKRLLAQNQMLETQLKEFSSKISVLEAKLLETQKPQKSNAAADDGSKVRVSQLEASLKKITQDLLESRNLLGEAKKDTNKLRQEKTALQNQLDKLKKDAEKAKGASPKNPGGKAA